MSAQIQKMIAVTLLGKGWTVAIHATTAEIRWRSPRGISGSEFISNSLDEPPEAATRDAYSNGELKDLPVTSLDALFVDKVKSKVSQFNASGSKYLRKLIGALNDGRVDVYAFLMTFNVTCPARQHAIKKLCFSGTRGKAGEMQDLSEARDAVDRAMQLVESSDKVEINGLQLPTSLPVWQGGFTVPGWKECD